MTDASTPLVVPCTVHRCFTEFGVGNDGKDECSATTGAIRTFAPRLPAPRVSCCACTLLGPSRSDHDT